MKTVLQTKAFGVAGTFALASVGVAAAILFAFASAPERAHAASNIPLCEISRSLTTGSSGADVQCLQRYLNWAGFQVSTYGAGSPGSETTYFGPRTAAAVAQWQNANRAYVLTPLGLLQGTGYWGPSSFTRYVEIVHTQLGV
jgi:hypothetical protein